MKMCPLLTILLPLAVATASAQVAVQAELLYPMTGDLRPIEDGVCSARKTARSRRWDRPGR